MKEQQKNQRQSVVEHKSPLELTSYNDLEDEFFGVVGTAEREAYDQAVELALIPSTIKEYRKKNGLTQEQLGNKIGVKKAQISQLERNASNVTISTLQRVFGALGTAVKIKLEPELAH
ncbi:helix-turn-helix domain-containing protein [Hymenobacter latericus]|uniref:helix-turn-helix domain-containing protein n=1 Tax=Hymenobacter sp. YIM 151858-1 TaxID=2987688 RepID=UPI002226D4A0|nr:helix-turn-helix transcriptional regulator [Hymenobacter sp. YIM 151858-1]UYZ61192.1 helix-turn-helix domain-containing protein [Hymenobacter sp. YIM 151858-1]